MVSVDPHAAVVSMQTKDGSELTLEPGREVVARVLASAGDGSARISLAGQVMEVTANASLRAGDEVRLSVTRADAGGVRFQVVAPREPAAQQLAVAPAAGNSSGAASSSSSVGRLVAELAKAGVPVTPQLTQALTNLASQLGGDGGGAARAVATLAGRDLALAPAVAGRVAAAIELAGSLGPSLASLADRSPEVAAALPSGPPSAAALRGLLAPNLSNAELAMARVAQAAQASVPGGPVTLPLVGGSSAAVIQNYVASQVAANASLDDLAAQGSLLGAGGRPPAPTTLVGLAPAAVQAALRGQAVGGAAVTPAAADVSAPTAAPAVVDAPEAAAQAARAAASATSSARSTTTAAAAASASAASGAPVTADAAQAVADLAMLATRFAPAMAGGAGALGGAEANAARGMHASETAQQAGRDGSTGAALASGAGAAASGDPAPIVTALQTYLASPGAEGDSARLLRALAGADAGTVAAALRSLPESQGMQVAGALLDLLGDGAALAGARLHELRQGVHGALNDLGRALQAGRGSGGADELAALRSALEHVAAHDPRPAVASDAARLLAAVDGQQLMSRTASGADPGYLYFQVPMPDGRGAEVMVRREPGRRAVSFDEFNIAFLLDTARIGTLMIQLDAHPAGIRADVRTDVAALEPFLRDRAEALMEPLARESRRPVIVTTGVFEAEPPRSLLDPQLGALTPGANEFYA